MPYLRSLMSTAFILFPLSLNTFGSHLLSGTCKLYFYFQGFIGFDLIMQTTEAFVLYIVYLCLLDSRTDRLITVFNCIYIIWTIFIVFLTTLRDVSILSQFIYNEP
jgi:hypothetical protein